MIECVIFDMDGVLIDARDWHYEALNEVLAMFGFEISRKDHENRFNGLPTKTKREILSKESGLPRGLHPLINRIKQERTLRIASFKCFPTAQHQILMAALKRHGIKIGVATNSVRITAESMLRAAGIYPFLDCLVTNQDVSKPKPDPEIYLRAMEKLGVRGINTLVVEDNQHGIRAATDAGCEVLKVESTSDVHIENLNKYFNGILSK